MSDPVAFESASRWQQPTPAPMSAARDEVVREIALRVDALATSGRSRPTPPRDATGSTLATVPRLSPPEDARVTAPADLRSLTAVVFDFDGTLVDSERVSRAAMTAVLAEDGYTLTDADHEAVVGRAWPHTRAYLMRTMGYDADGIASYQHRVRRAFRARLDEVVAFPDAAATLETLAAAHVPVAVCTSSGRTYLERLLDQRGLADLVDGTVAREDTDEHKPLPAPYLLAASRLGVEAARCVAVEDTPTGVAAARAAGMHVVGVARHLGLDLSEAHLVVSEVTPAALVQVMTA